jgi:hypothetical protein
LSIFKTKWIILKIHKIKPWEFLYTIFTREYWKIICNKKISKKEKTLDLWYLINFEIITKEELSIHKIKNIKIISEFSNDKKTFYELNTYLTILSIVLNKTPKWIAIYEMFDLLELLNSTNTINEIKLILFKLKIISIFWELNEKHKNKTVWKILKFINSNKINNIIKLTWIDNKTKKELESI